MFSDFYDVTKRPAAVQYEGWQPPFKDPAAPVNPRQGLWEFTALLEIYKRLAPQRVVEIGTFCGGSLYQWMKYAKAGTKIIAIDLPGGAFGHPETARYANLWPTWAPAGVEFHSILASSYDPATHRRVLAITDRIDFLFIDGDHAYQGVKADFMMYGPLVKRGGVIALHDIVPNLKDTLCGVHALWTEIRKAGYITQELYVNPLQGCLGIGVIYIV